MKKNIIMKIVGFVICGLLIFQAAFSQENYIAGYVIKNSTDTLFGFVDNRNWEHNPNQIKFKTNIKNTPITFNPTEITEFGFDGEIYESGIINTEITSLQTDKLKTDPKLNIKVYTAFLQTLYRGEKSLYYYKNSEGRENFYIKDDTGFDLLIYKKYLKAQDEKYVVSHNKKYYGQLNIYLKDCATISSKLDKTLYAQNSLMDLFKYYYDCSSSDFSFKKEKEKIQIEIGVLAGASLTTLKFRSATFDYLVGTRYNHSINF